MTDAQFLEEVGDAVRLVVKKALEAQAEAHAAELAGVTKQLKAIAGDVTHIKAWVDAPNEPEKEEDWVAGAGKLLDHPVVGPHASRLLARLSEHGAIDKMMDRLVGKDAK